MTCLRTCPPPCWPLVVASKQTCPCRMPWPILMHHGHVVKCITILVRISFGEWTWTRRAFPACPSCTGTRDGVLRPLHICRGGHDCLSSAYPCPLALSWFSGPICQLRALRALGLRVLTLPGGFITLRITGGRAIIIAVSKCHIQPLSWKAIFYGAELAYVAVRAKFSPVLQ